MNTLIDVLNLSILSAVFIAVVILMRFILKRMPKWVNMLMWTLVAIRLLCPFTITSSVGVIPEKIIDPNDQTLSEYVGNNEWGIPVELNPSEGSEVNGSGNNIDIETVCKIVWATGSVIMIAAGTVSYIGLKKRSSVSIRIDDNVYICDDIDNGFVIGIFKPRIMIPSTLDSDLSAHVIRHEKMHIKHNDHIRKLIGYVLLSLNWFNPFVWAAYICFCRDMELYCDEAVTEDYSMKDRAEYSYALLLLASDSVSLSNVAFGEIDLKTRINAIKKEKRPSFRKGLIGAGLVFVVSVFFLTNSAVTEKLYRSQWEYPESDMMYIHIPTAGSVTFEDYYDSASLRANVNAYLSKYYEEYADNREDLSFLIQDAKIVYDDTDPEVNEHLIAYVRVMADEGTDYRITVLVFDFELDGRDYYLRDVSTAPEDISAEVPADPNKIYNLI